MNPISSKFSWKYQKNRHFLDSLVLRNAPRFIYASDPGPIRSEIPVFTFHGVSPDSFEEQCRYLVENDYRTLSAAGFVDCMKNGSGVVENAVLLTFDDGLKSIWTVAYPLLKKYQLRATCFLLPGCISEETHHLRPTLEDSWNGKAALDDVIRPAKGPLALANWAELRKMHQSGHVDFQSHSMYHSLVATSAEIFDFIHPGYDPYYFGNIHVPLYTENGADVYSREPVLGMPVYCAKPRMQALRRFYDDETVRRRCAEFVRDEGQSSFFAKKAWRRILKNKFLDLRKTIAVQERYEKEDERNAAVFQELCASKEIIEHRLPGNTVDQLCFPWYQAEQFAIDASKKAGFRVNYFGQIKNRPVNRPGDDLFGVARVENIFLKRLPGKGRESLAQIIGKHLVKMGLNPERTNQTD